MNLLFTLLLSIGIPLLYIMVAGFVGNYLTDRSRLECGIDPETYCYRYQCEHGWWWLAGIFWPIAVPFVIASSLSTALAYDHTNGIGREERKLRQQVIAAENTAKIMEIREAEIKKMERAVGIQ